MNGHLKTGLKVMNITGPDMNDFGLRSQKDEEFRINMRKKWRNLRKES